MKYILYKYWDLWVVRGCNTELVSVYDVDKICSGMGLIFLLMLPLDMNCLSDLISVLVMILVSWIILSVGMWFLSS